MGQAGGLSRCTVQEPLAIQSATSPAHILVGRDTVVCQNPKREYALRMLVFGGWGRNMIFVHMYRVWAKHRLTVHDWLWNMKCARHKG